MDLFEQLRREYEFGVGSIAGVFVSGYFLIDELRISTIFRIMGGLTIFLGLLCLGMDRWLYRNPNDE